MKFAGREAQQVLKELDVPVSEKLGEQILESFKAQGGSYTADAFKAALTFGFKSSLRSSDRNCTYSRAVREYLPFAQKVFFPSLTYLVVYFMYD